MRLHSLIIIYSAVFIYLFSNIQGHEAELDCVANTPNRINAILLIVFNAICSTPNSKLNLNFNTRNHFNEFK